MNDIRIMGAIFFVVGILMAVFHRAVGIGFCRMGKRIWGNTSSFAKNRAPDMIKLYDEAKVPRTMLILGIVFAAEGVVFLVLSKFIG